MDEIIFVMKIYLYSSLGISDEQVNVLWHPNPSKFFLSMLHKRIL